MLTWFIAGTILMLLEFATLSFILIFFGIGAWGAALTAYLFPGTPQEIITFITVTCFSLFFMRSRFKNIFTGFKGGQQKNPITENFAYLGQQAIVKKAITPNTEGEIFVGGSFWRARSNVDIAKDTMVIIEKIDANDSQLIIVKPIH